MVELVGVRSDSKGRGFVIAWGVPGKGFGELTIQQDAGGTLHIDTKHMGKEFAKQVLCALVEQAVDVAAPKENTHG